MPPPPRKPAPQPPAEDRGEVTDPGAPIDLLKTGSMRIAPRKPAPHVFKKAPTAPEPEELTPPGERTLVYDQNKGRAVPGQAAARLVITAGPRAGSEVTLAQLETSIGRGGDNTIVVPDISVSRRHAVVRQEPSGYVVLDQGSGNGTRVNGLVVGRHELQSGDVIDLGDTSLQFVEAGGILVKSGKRAASGSNAAVAGPIRAGGAKAASQDDPELDKSELTNPRGTSLQKRTPLYLGVGLALVAAISAGYLRKRVKERAEAAAAESTGSKAAAQKHFAEAAALVKAGKWVEARDRLAIAASLDDQDEEIRRYLDRARLEAPRAQAVAAAQEALSRRNYKGAREQLSQVPEDSALSGAAGDLQDKIRTQIDLAVNDAKAKADTGDPATAEALLAPVLEAEPTRRDALAVREQLGARRRAQVAVRARTQAPDEEAEPDKRAAEEPAPPLGLRTIVETYLTGDLRSAITRAESAGVTDARAAKMARELRDLDQAYREGLAKADAKKPGEAMRALEVADRLDKSISGGQPSRMGTELRKILSRVHYQLGAAGMQSDEGLPAAARHLRSAVLADPDNDLAKQQLDQAVARAKELYLRAYVVKDTDTPAAREMFKLVVDILPGGDATAAKAKHWMEKIDGKPQRDDPAPE